MKAREFLIYKGESGLQVSEAIYSYTDREVRFHVIEKSAYDKAVEALMNMDCQCSGKGECSRCMFIVETTGSDIG